MSASEAPRARARSPHPLLSDTPSPPPLCRTLPPPPLSRAGANSVCTVLTISAQVPWLFLSLSWRLKLSLDCKKVENSRNHSTSLVLEEAGACAVAFSPAPGLAPTSAAALVKTCGASGGAMFVCAVATSDVNSITASTMDARSAKSVEDAEPFVMPSNAARPPKKKKAYQYILVHTRGYDTGEER